MAESAAWLDAHTSGAPDALRERMRSALGSSDASANTPQALADAALRELASVLVAPSPRSAALGLLAADALLTAAFEAAADEPASIRQLARQYDPARLAVLLAP